MQGLIGEYYWGIYTSPVKENLLHECAAIVPGKLVTGTG